MTASSKEEKKVENKKKEPKLKRVLIHPDNSLNKVNTEDKDLITNHCVAVSSSCGTMYKETANALAEIKSIIKNSNAADNYDEHWYAWTMTNDCMLGSRTIRDLVSCNEWFKKTPLTNDILGNHSIRVLARIVSASIYSSDLIPSIEKRMSKSEKITESILDTILNKQTREKSEIMSKKQLRLDRDRIESELANALNIRTQMEEDLANLVSERDELSREVNRLKATVDTLTDMRGRLTTPVTTESAASYTRIT